MRRALLRAAGAAFAGALATVGAGPAAHAAEPERRLLRLHSVNTGESLEVVYRVGDDYEPEALAACNRLLRDRRTGDVGEIDPRLLDLLHALAERLGSRAPFHVISAYRSPATNATRAATPGSGVASDSLHVKGQAIDVRLPGVPLERLRDAAIALGKGGVGFYPDSDFVHVDLGKPRRW